MTLKVNSWTEFQPLKTVMVGDVYDQTFFDGIKNDTIREGLKEIVGGTKEDIQYFDHSNYLTLFKECPLCFFLRCLPSSFSLSIN